MSRIEMARKAARPTVQKREQPVAIYKCGRCLFEKHIRADYAPPILQCLHCDRGVRPKIIRVEK